MNPIDARRDNTMQGLHSSRPSDEYNSSDGSDTEPRRPYLRSYASSSALPFLATVQNGRHEKGDSQRHRVDLTRNPSPPTAYPPKTFLAPPLTRRFSSSETVSPFTSNTASQPNTNFSGEMLERDLPRHTTPTTLPRPSVATRQRSITTNGSFMSSSSNPVVSGTFSLLNATVNGLPSSSVLPTTSVPGVFQLPAHPPPPYDIACANGSTGVSALPRSQPRSRPSTSRTPSPRNSTDNLLAPTSSPVQTQNPALPLPRLADLQRPIRTLHADGCSDGLSSPGDSSGGKKNRDSVYPSSSAVASRRRRGKPRAVDVAHDRYLGDSASGESIPEESSSTFSAGTASLRSSLKSSDKRGITTRLVRFSMSWRGESGSGVKGKQRGEMIETETETDEPRHPSRQLPSRRQFGLGLSDLRWRRTNSNGPLSPLGAAMHHPSHDHHNPEDDPSLKFTINLNKLTPFLFQFSRYLSVVPAFFGVLFCIWQMFNFDVRGFVEDHWTCVPVGDGSAGVKRCSGPPLPGKVDWFVAGLWALLTAYHCLGLTTGLLMRWKLYYPPLATLVRLLGLQGICWPATQLTLSVVGGFRRPVMAWAIIGTTTAVSRSIQIWVTSNIIWINDKALITKSGDIDPNGHHSEEGERPNENKNNKNNTREFFNRMASIIGGDDSNWAEGGSSGKLYRRRERRWDWKKVGIRCLLPTAFLYVVMAWAEVGRREWQSQYGGGMYLEAVQATAQTLITS